MLVVGEMGRLLYGASTKIVQDGADLFQKGRETALIIETSLTGVFLPSKMHVENS
jgi:hypothetical protein